MGSIFKAYDIRGRYPDEVNEGIAYRIGACFVRLLQGGVISSLDTTCAFLPRLLPTLLRKVR